MEIRPCYKVVNNCLMTGSPWIKAVLSCLVRVIIWLLSFLGLASQDPFASNFVPENPNLGIGHNIIPGIFPVSDFAFDLQTPPALTVAPNCSQVPYYLVDQIVTASSLILLCYCPRI